jgi:hypothetical protein
VARDKRCVTLRLTHREDRGGPREPCSQDPPTAQVWHAVLHPVHLSIQTYDEVRPSSICCPVEAVGSMYRYMGKVSSCTSRGLEFDASLALNALQLRPGVRV